MNDNEARALGRWCATHRRQYERVHLPNGVAATGCPDCVTAPEFVAAMDAFVAAAAAYHFKPTKERP